MEVWKVRTLPFLLTAPSFSLPHPTFLFCAPYTSQSSFIFFYCWNVFYSHSYLLRYSMSYFFHGASSGYSAFYSHGSLNCLNYFTNSSSFHILNCVVQFHGYVYVRSVYVPVCLQIHRSWEMDYSCFCFCLPSTFSFFPWKEALPPGQICRQVSQTSQVSHYFTNWLSWFT